MIFFSISVSYWTLNTLDKYRESVLLLIICNWYNFRLDAYNFWHLFEDYSTKYFVTYFLFTDGDNNFDYFFIFYPEINDRFWQGMRYFDFIIYIFGNIFLNFLSRSSIIEKEWIFLSNYSCWSIIICSPFMLRNQTRLK